MSNAIRYDSLLVRHLARELDERLRGEPARAIQLDPAARRAAIELEAVAVVFELHPSRGEVWLGPPPAAAVVLPLRRRSVVRAVASPADERRLVIALAGTGTAADRPRQVVFELMTNQWNTLVLGDGGRILEVLWRRAAGGRQPRPGAVYVPPPAPARRGAVAPLSLEAWLALLEPVAPEARVARLVDGVAWTSPLNAPAILGGATLTEAYDRYLALVRGAPAAPVTIETHRGRQPYPFPLPGVRYAPHASLLDAIATAAGARLFESAGFAAAPGAGATVPRVAPEILERLRGRIRQAEARISRLESELARAAPDAAGLRRQADVLLANLRGVQKGARRIELPDFAGGTVTLELDPALPPAENAARLYRAAKKRERAADRVPPLLARARAEVGTLRGVLEGAERGEVGEAAARAAAGAPASGAPAAIRAGTAAGAGGHKGEVVLPYRRYRTSSGLEARVGRGAKENDDLTFRHASPDDIWLHARDTAGAHVILRWPQREANPPARDLHEAAALAALHSRARTSGVVPVDWTRRKHVRKPRKAPPGRVAVERARTVFVEPDEALEKRLRVT